MPKKIATALSVSNVRLYLNANNLLTFTRYRGYDPEVNHNNVGTNITIGYDNGTYPNARNFVGGFSINF